MPETIMFGNVRPVSTNLLSEAIGEARRSFFDCSQSGIQADGRAVTEALSALREWERAAKEMESAARPVAPGAAIEVICVAYAHLASSAEIIQQLQSQLVECIRAPETEIDPDGAVPGVIKIAMAQLVAAMDLIVDQTAAMGSAAA